MNVAPTKSRAVLIIAGLAVAIIAVGVVALSRSGTDDKATPVSTGMTIAQFSDKWVGYTLRLDGDTLVALDDDKSTVLGRLDVSSASDVNLKAIADLIKYRPVYSHAPAPKPTLQGQLPSDAKNTTTGEPVATPTPSSTS